MGTPEEFSKNLTPITNSEELQQRILFTSGIIQNVLGDFHRMRLNFEKRIRVCVEHNGDMLNI